MSLDTYLSTTRQVGDASICRTEGSKMQFVTPRDGQFFDVGNTEWVMTWRFHKDVQQAIDGEENTLRPNDAFQWCFNNSLSNTDNCLYARWRPGFSNDYLQARWREGGSDVALAQLDYGSGTPETGWSVTCRTDYIAVLRYMGTTLTLGIVGNGQYASPYALHKVDVTGVTLNFDNIGQGGSGYFIWGDSYPGDHDASIYMNGFFAATVGGGDTLADYGLDTDAGLVELGIDPHAVVSRNAFANKRSFDWCDSRGNRKEVKYQQQLEPDDQIICIHSGTVGQQQINPLDDGTPTRIAEGRTPYCPMSYIGGGQYRNDILALPPAVKRGSVIVSAETFFMNNNNTLAYAWARRLASTGERFAPVVPIADARWAVDSSDSDTVKKCWKRTNQSAEGHHLTAIQIDETTGRIVTVTSRHSDIYSDWPESSDTAIESGSVGSFFADGTAATCEPIPYNSLTGSQRASTYAGGMVERSGYVYTHIRRATTPSGRNSMVRIAPNGTVESLELTNQDLSSNTLPTPAIPYSAVALDNDHILFVGGCRLLNGGNDYGYPGIWGWVLDATTWDSTPAVYGARDGTDLSGSLGTLDRDEPSLFLASDPTTLAMIDAGTYNSSNQTIDVNVAGGNPVIKATKGDVTYIGLLVAEHNDPLRRSGGSNTATFIGKAKTALRVYSWDADTHTLSFSHEHDFTELLRDLVKGSHPYFDNGNDGAPFVWPRILNTSGTALTVIVPYANSVDFSNSWYQESNALGGTETGFILSSDWTEPDAVFQLVENQFPIARYNAGPKNAAPNAAAYMAYPITGDANGQFFNSPILETQEGQDGAQHHNAVLNQASPGDLVLELAPQIIGGISVPVFKLQDAADGNGNGNEFVVSPNGAHVLIPSSGVTYDGATIHVDIGVKERGQSSAHWAEAETYTSGSAARFVEGCSDPDIKIVVRTRISGAGGSTDITTVAVPA